MINDTDIKHELDHGDTVTQGYSDEAGVAMDTPRSWDSGVALDSVTALQMAEFQAVVDNLHRQVVSHTSPPPYPGPGDTNMFLTNSLFPNTAAGPHTYHPSHHGARQKYENPTKNGCHSLPANGLIPPKIIDKVENKYASNQRYEEYLATISVCTETMMMTHLTHSVIVTLGCVFSK